MRRILVLGSINIDDVYAVEHIVVAGETISSRSVSHNAGGKGANQAAALAKAGLDVCFAGKMGSDGKWVLDILSSMNVDTGYTIADDSFSTGHAIIQVDDKGQNSIILYAGGNKEFTESDIDNILGNFSENDILLLQNEINLIDYAIREASRKGLYICFNPSPFDSDIRELPLELVDCFFVNELEGAALAEWEARSGKDICFHDLAMKLCTLYPESSFVLTAGADGAYYAESGKVFHAPARECTVRDTTGAGDTFCGYFISARVLGYPIEKALEIANKAASITVSRDGAMESMPVSGEVF